MTDALMMAPRRRDRPREVLHLYDQDCQYTSEQFQMLLIDQAVIVCSGTKAFDHIESALNNP